MLAAALARAVLLEPLDYIEVPVTKRALVVGGGIAGLSAALDLAETGRGNDPRREVSELGRPDGPTLQNLSHYGLPHMNSRPQDG